jgi:hypothetical protein
MQTQLVQTVSDARFGFFQPKMHCFAAIVLALCSFWILLDAGDVSSVPRSTAAPFRATSGAGEAHARQAPAASMVSASVHAFHAVHAATNRF